MVIAYSMGHQKVPVFRNTLPYNGNFAFRVRCHSVLQLPVFLLLCQHFKTRRKERLKNSKKNNAKNGVKTVPKRVKKIITVQRTFKKQCNNVFTSVPIGQMVFNDYAKSRILLLQEHGKRTKEMLVKKVQ